MRLEKIINIIPSGFPKTKTPFLKIRWLLFSLMFGTLVKGQLVQTDPYKIDYFVGFNLEFDRNEILENGIHKASVETVYLRKNGKAKKGTLLRNFTEFDSRGNPVYSSNRNTKPRWKWPKFRQKFGLNNGTSDTYQYFFKYDEGRLTKIKEVIYESYFKEHHENEVLNKYDERGRLVKQVIAEAYIYPEGYKYRGVSFPNDTSWSYCVLTYDSLNRILFTVTNFKEYPIKAGGDTSFYKYSLDSVSYDSPLDSANLDSDGRVIISELIRTHVRFMGGSSGYIEGPNDIITKLQYNKQGKLKKVDRHNRKGDYLGTTIYQYLENGMIQCHYTLDDRYETIYKYE